MCEVVENMKKNNVMCQCWTILLALVNGTVDASKCGTFNNLKIVGVRRSWNQRVVFFVYCAKKGLTIRKKWTPEIHKNEDHFDCFKDEKIFWWED